MGFKLFLLFEKFLMILPKKLRKAFFSFLGSVAYYLSSRYRDVSLANLNFIFQNTLSENEKIKITKYSFKNLMFNFLHLMEIRHMDEKQLHKKVRIKNIEAVKKAHEDGRAIIYISAHYSSWELGFSALGSYVENIAGVFKKMNNLEYQNWVLESRGKFGNTALEKENVIKPLIKQLRQKKAVGIIIDTTINPKEGLNVSFFGKTIRQTSTPAYLARKFNACIIPVTIKTNDDEYYELTLFDEIKVDKTDNEKEDIQKATQLQADWLSKLIEDDPKFWFWVHRRFKNEYPQIYKKKK